METRNRKSHALFAEEQRFRQWWLWVLMGAVAVGGGYSIFESAVNENSGWKDAMTSAILPLLIVAIGAAYLWIFKLKTRISQEGIQVNIGPFPRINRSIAFADMQKCYVRRYQPLGEYGGWGVKGSKSNRVYNISGDEGLQIVFSDGKKLLIGTKKPEEITAVLYKLGAVKV